MSAPPAVYKRPVRGLGRSLAWHLGRSGQVLRPAGVLASTLVGASGMTVRLPGGSVMIQAEWHLVPVTRLRDIRVS
jgi:hypothetical protein